MCKINQNASQLIYCCDMLFHLKDKVKRHASKHFS
nr:MAG TPA: hypothetical protein [Caudoviricetes sp.]DAV75436.1 MAG TPA: hypothetical protein [Caudoviricetes sp.]